MARNPENSTPGLVVTRTPLRVSFAGGGTDLPDFYEREYGAVLSTAIDKYIYVTVKRHGDLFDEPIRLNYSKTEQVKEIEKIENNIARECLRFLKVDPPIYISTVADLPASTGLGGSSSFAVGLLNALYAFRGQRVSAGQLAEEASHIEIDVLKQPIGKQDQYAAAFGGVNVFSFTSSGSVTVEPQRLSNGWLEELFDHIMMFWTGIRRDSSSVLFNQKSNTASNIEYLLRMRSHAHELQNMLSNGVFDAGAIGRILDEGWKLKRQLARCITNSQIDTWYDRAVESGADGGKICGAGGGGFFLFIVRPERHNSVRRSLTDLTEISVRHEVHGSRVLLPFGQ